MKLIKYFFIHLVIFFHMTSLALEQNLDSVPFYCSQFTISLCNFSGQHAYSVKKKSQEALKIFQYTCQLGSEKGCYNAGLIFSSLGLEIESNNFFQKACTHPSICKDIGIYLMKQESYNSAFLYFDKSCSMKDETGCQFALQAAMKLKNTDYVIKYLEPQCSTLDQIIKSKETCVLLSQAYSLKGDLEKANNTLDTLCKTGVLNACSELGKNLIQTIKGQQLLSGACLNKVYDACNFLAQYYFKNHNYMKSYEYALKSCNSDMNTGCLYIGKIEEASGNKVAAILNYKTACTIGDNEGCMLANKILQKNIEDDLKKAY